MPCGLRHCEYLIGKMIYISERLAGCCALAAVISCIMAFLMFSISVGIGIGYNYCYYNERLQEYERIREAMEKNSTNVITSTEEEVSLTDETVTRKIVLRHRNDSEASTPKLPGYIQERVDPANILSDGTRLITVPMASSINLTHLISQLLRSKENVTIQLLRI